jgi:LPS-assembly lipoprotein
MRAALRRRSLLGTGSLALLLAGCGFELRKPPSFAFASIYLAVPPMSQLGLELQRALAASGGVSLVTDQRQVERADLVFELLQELREKVVLGRTSTGAVREYQLRIRLRFKVRNRQGIERIPDTELVQQRDISYSESFALAKEAEEDLLYRNMQTDLVRQILRRLAALRDI